MLAGPVVFLVLGIRDEPSPLLTWLTTWGTVILYGLGAIVIGCAAHAQPSRRSLPWFVLACLLWTSANLYYARFVAPDPIPLPSPADIGYFLFPWAAGVGVVQATRARLPRVPADVLLDALIIALCAGAVAAALIFSFVDVATDSFGVVLNSFVYPVEDVFLIGIMVGVGTLLRWRLERPLLILLVGLTAITAGDLVVATRVLNGDPVGGVWSNFGWTLGIALVAIGAWDRTPQPQERLARPFVTHVSVPAVAASIALLIVAGGAVFGLTRVGSSFAIATLAVACLRMHLSFREARELADSHRLALADELTDLPNRRRLMRDLRVLCDGEAPHLLALYDLDGFKHYNDTYGHGDGDGLLIALSARLAAAAAPVGTAYRLGGDEFCVLAPAGDEGERVVRAAGMALAANGPDWRVTATYGVVEIPREAADPSDAVRVADRRMYAEKERRPVAARQQVRDALLSALGEQHPGLHTHAQDVTALAGAVAVQFGMRPNEVDEVVRAAELHDVGKIAIPPGILDKPGPLDDDEWRVMHQHTIIGERMLHAAPALRAIAPLVRSSHERWDGAGYPDRLRGEDIPLGARIVAVCDAYDAMVANRPYRAGMPSSEALAELRRSAGTQFDPDVVDVFVRLVETNAFAA